MRTSSRKLLTWPIYCGRSSGARFRDWRVLKSWEKSATLRGSVMKEYPFAVFSMTSAICVRGTSGRLVAKSSLSCRMRCASLIMPRMKLRSKDDIWITSPLKVNDSSESHEIEADMLMGWDEKMVRPSGQTKLLLSEIGCARQSGRQAEVPHL